MKGASNLKWLILGIVVLLILAGGLYLYTGKSGNYTPVSQGQGQGQGQGQQVSGDTSYAALKQEASSIDLKNLDKELGDIDKELAK